jgi:curved DNA-binding protein CbpA
MYKDYYSILGISPQATVADIKLAYRTLAKQLHPDVVGDNAAKQLQFNEVKKAYETLMNPATRYQFHEERWLLKAEGKQYASYTPVTATRILKDSLALEREVHFMDSNRNYEIYIATKLSELLSKEHLLLVQKENDTSIKEAIIACVIKLLPNLPVDFLPIIQEKMLALHITDVQQEVLCKAISKRKSADILNRYKWIIILVTTLVLLLLMQLLVR